MSKIAHKWKACLQISPTWVCNIFVMQAILYRFKRDVIAWKRLRCPWWFQRTWWQILATPYTGFRLLHESIDVANWFTYVYKHISWISKDISNIISTYLQLSWRYHWLQYSHMNFPFEADEHSSCAHWPHPWHFSHTPPVCDLSSSQYSSHLVLIDVVTPPLSCSLSSLYLGTSYPTPSS